MTRRFISWRAGRRLLLALALVATLVAVVYAIEDWRGRRAWDRCRRELEARGEKLEWEAFVPASVPNESNFFKAPGMTAWFSKQASATNQNVRLFSVTPSDTRGWPLTLEELRALPEDRVSGSTNNLSRAELRERFAELGTEYKTLAVACARAQSRLGDDYRVPVTVDIPNFARARSAAQSLSVHANLNLLDERPDVALADLAMMRRLADAMAENQTLVGTMIGVAIMGLHAIPAPRDVHVASTLEGAAVIAAGLAARAEPRDLQIPPGDLDDLVEAQARGLAKGQRFVRGLYSGGTLAWEAAALLAERLDDVAAGVSGEGKGHRVVDLGGDVFTVGRPHPMIDGAIRSEWITREAADPTTAVLLLDVVLGYGAHRDPAGELRPVVEEARRAANAAGRGLAVIASVTGTEQDPQRRSAQVAALRRAGVAVMDSNAQAARLAALVAARLA